MMTNFNDFRFEGLDYIEISNKYFAMKRVSNDCNKIVVKVADTHLIETKFGYALILNRYQVVFLKAWQVDRNWYGNEVLLTREYFNVKNWGEHFDFSEELNNNTFEEWLKVAQAQDALVDEDGMQLNYVRWKK